MRWRTRVVNGTSVGRMRLDVVDRRWIGHMQLVVLAMLVCGCLVEYPVAVSVASESCPNAVLRVGASAGLPDCRAYELVTPADKGRTQDMTFGNLATDRAISSSNGEDIALQSTVPFGPSPSVVGTRAVFSRSPSGWVMHSVVTPEANGDKLFLELFSPNLSQVGFESFTQLNTVERSRNRAFEVGPVGGPYKLVASIPNQDNGELLGSTADFSNVLFDTTDHSLLFGAEGAVAEGTVENAPDLYDWTDGQLQLVNVTTQGSLVNACGANLGQQEGSGGEGGLNAVSKDGSKIFFTAPGVDARPGLTGPSCKEPIRLYMRTDNRETVELSAPAPGVKLEPSEILSVRYNAATPDGSYVFFNTESALTADDASKANKLFEYNTATGLLKRIASGVERHTGQGPYFVMSEDGSTVYYETAVGNGVKDIYRYDLSTGEPPSFVATIGEPRGSFAEPSYTTPDGRFLLFVAAGRPGEAGVVGEPRGSGHNNESYRYNAADGSVICVSCGQGNAPAEGEMLEPQRGRTEISTGDETPGLIPMSDDGRYVFFQTTSQLVPQDTNSTATIIDAVGGENGRDVYEWEVDGAGGCELTQGCTYLISSGEASGPSVFLGASSTGRDVFFATPARLAPQDVDEFDDIYDARIDGGFLPPSPSLECLSCQGVGSPPPLFNFGASLTFMGAGNPTILPVKKQPKSRHEKSMRKKRHGTKGKGRSKTAGGSGKARLANERGKRS